MDNVSKTLLIAGAVLIGVLILSFGVYEYNKLEKVSESYSEKGAREQILEFNANFTIYQSRNEELGEITTAQDVVTVANFAKDYNEKHGYQVGDPKHVTVNVINTPSRNYSRFETRDIEYMNDFIDMYSKNLYTGETIKFECKDKDIVYDNDGKVSSITFRFTGRLGYNAEEVLEYLKHPNRTPVEPY